MPAGSITGLTRLVLTNAVYFKGKWATPFDKQATKNEPFTVKPGTAPAVPMMRKTLKAGFGKTADASVLELAYEAQSPERQLAMVVVLPAQVDGLAQVEQRLAAGQLKAYVDALEPARVDVPGAPALGEAAELELSAASSAGDAARVRREEGRLLRDHEGGAALHLPGAPQGVRGGQRGRTEAARAGSS